MTRLEYFTSAVLGVNSLGGCLTSLLEFATAGADARRTGDAIEAAVLGVVALAWIVWTLRIVPSQPES